MRAIAYVEEHPEDQSKMWRDIENPDHAICTRTWPHCIEIVWHDGGAMFEVTQVRPIFIG